MPWDGGCARAGLEKHQKVGCRLGRRTHESLARSFIATFKKQNKKKQFEIVLKCLWCFSFPCFEISLRFRVSSARKKKMSPAATLTGDRIGNF